MTKIIKGIVDRWRKKDWSHWEDVSKVVEYCGKKIIYKTMMEAEEKRLRQQEKNMMQLKIYSCEQCGHYHLTSQK